ncbi:MAG: leucine-rich repeat protein [Sodaliphilus sp.]
MYNYFGPAVKGDLVIPSHVTTTKDGEEKEYTVVQIGRHTFDGNDSVTSITIPNTVTSIGDSCFYGCAGLASINIPESVTTMGDGTFYGCTGLNSVKYDAVNVTQAPSKEESWFRDCANLTDFTIGNQVQSIPDYLCNGLSKISTIILPKTLTYIGYYAFAHCTGLTFIQIPNSVSTLKKYAFKGCTNVDINAFVGPYMILRRDKELHSGIYNEIFHDWKSINLIGSPLYDITFKSVHQELISFFIASVSDNPTPEGYERIEAVETGIYRYGNYYPCDSEGKVALRNLKSSTKYYFQPYAKYADGTLLMLDEHSLTTNSLGLKVASQDVQPTSISAQFSHKMDDAVFDTDYIMFDAKSTDGQHLLATGLQPNTTYTASYSVRTKGGSFETKDFSFSTPSLVLKMLTPKGVTSTNTIVAAETNMSDQETSAGFQWKKYDAPSTLAPKEAFAAIYDGRLEGYIKNLQSTSYYNVRAFYKDAAGNYTYSDWVTFDPSDFSYFEPTVHTYPTNEVSASSATVKGYVLPGSDEILKQGVEYWIAGAANAPMKVMSPMAASAKDTVFATGQVMIVTLKNLKPSTDYCYRAFVTTQAGNTYGEEQSFTTDFGVGDVNADGVVNVSDVTALVNKILQSADTFESVCDVNADGVVNVSDVTALVNIILNNSSAAKKHAIEVGIKSDDPIAPTTTVVTTAIQAL